MPRHYSTTLSALIVLAAIGGGPTTDGAEPTVTIHRDEWGVPHIFADAEEAGFYGLGYAQAEDQLEFVLRFFLSARGEMAAALGGEFIASDVQSRTWRHVVEAREGWSRLSPQLQTNYRHYVAGINRYMSDNPDRTPDWAPLLEAQDVVALSRWLLWMAYQAGHGIQDCRRGGVQLASRDIRAVDRGSRVASNEWILAPWRTADNSMIVLSDPHGGIDGAFVYESRIHAGSLDVAGYSVGGMLLLTHNANVSWGMTTGAPDVADCYEIEVDPNHPLRYRYDGGWREMITEQITIAVRDSQPVTRTLEYARHNEILSPVVARSDDKAYVVSTSYMHRAGDFDEEVYRINLAKNIAEVKEAMTILGMFPQNVMFGDRDGNSWYVRAGRAPRRPDGHDWNRPVPGNTSATAWLGIHPLEDLVQLETPVAGYMQNTNVSPDRMLENSPLTADRYPAYLYNDIPDRTNTRGVRANEALSQAYDFSIADAVELSLDEKWVGTDAWRSALRAALSSNPGRVAGASPLFRRFARRILTFDGHARQQSVAALNYLLWRERTMALAGELPESDRGSLSDPLWEKAEPPVHLHGVVLDAVDAAVEDMVERYGSIDVKLGDVFRIGRGGYSFPLGGASIVRRDRGTIACAYTLECTFTLRAMTFDQPDSLGHRNVLIGSRLLRLVQFTEPLRSFTLHNFGQSEDPESPHYVDQARMTSERRLKPTYFNPGELTNHVVSTVVLEVRIER